MGLFGPSQHTKAVASMNTAADTLTKAVDAAKPEAARTFNNAAHETRLAGKQFGASVKEAWRSVAGVFGADTSKWGSTIVKGDAAKIAESASQKAGIFQRIASKPFRVAANNPKTALLGAAALGAVGIGSWLSGRSERRTQENAMAEVAAVNRQMSTYMNSVSPQEYAMMQERIASKGQTHADAAVASRQEAMSAAAQPSA